MMTSLEQEDEIFRTEAQFFEILEIFPFEVCRC